MELKQSPNIDPMTSADVRTTLLATHRTQLACMLKEAGVHEPAGSLVAYLLAVAEPSGYLIAAALQWRFGEPDPDRVIHVALVEATRAPLVAGVIVRSALAETLATLAPAIRPLAVHLQAPDIPSARRVLIAAGGGAELFTLDDPPPAPESIST
jgi:hypothetical protein